VTGAGESVVPPHAHTATTPTHDVTENQAATRFIDEPPSKSVPDKIARGRRRGWRAPQRAPPTARPRIHST